MSHVSQISAQFQIVPQPVQGTQVNMGFSHIPLERNGFAMLVAISTPAALKQAAPSAPVFTETVTALFDTGASRTSIDGGLAERLHFIPVGLSTTHTAAGPVPCTDYVADISFPGTALKPFRNLHIGSCKLPVVSGGDVVALTPQNFGMLIGRDVMAKWHITWHGPTSTVFISD